MKVRMLRVLEYTVDCALADSGLQYLEKHLEQRTVKEKYVMGPLTIREAYLGRLPEVIIEEQERGQADGNNSDIQG